MEHILIGNETRRERPVKLRKRLLLNNKTKTDSNALQQFAMSDNFAKSQDGSKFTRWASHGKNDRGEKVFSIDPTTNKSNIISVNAYVQNDPNDKVD